MRAAERGGEVNTAAGRGGQRTVAPAADPNNPGRFGVDVTATYLPEQPDSVYEHLAASVHPDRQHTSPDAHVPSL